MDPARTHKTSRAHDTDKFNPAHKLGDLSPREQDEIGQQSRPSALLLHETIRAEGEAELGRPATALVCSGLAAGLSMGFSMVVEGLLHEHLPAAPWRSLLSNLGYTIGFLIVVLGRQQLFTENTLTPVLPLLHDRDARTFVSLLRLWTLVLVANTLGTFLFAAAVAHTSVFDAASKTAFLEISREAFNSPPSTIFVKAIFAGWLIALMVWLLPAMRGTGRAITIIILTYVVALGGFSHIVAGSVDGFYLVESGEKSVADFMVAFFIPTLIGNIVGGVALVAILNYGQVAQEVDR